MEGHSSYLTLSSGSYHSLLAFPPPLATADLRRKYRMTTYARPSPPLIDTLPIEILSYIFTFATHASFEPQHSGDFGESPEGAPAFNTESVKTPLVFASVSRYWRRVALNTPNLWTSLCITLEMVHLTKDESNSPSSSSSTPTPSFRIDTRHITSYLLLSRQYPIDILIDARDQDWDFLEDEITPDSESYTPPFTVKHMQNVCSLLLPHLSRWRSLNILTDTWKPMQTALQSINPAILQHGAPRLESLTLMRCNDFVSFSPEFEPKSLKDPSFLSNTAHTPPPQSPNILPRLRYLSLRGVHVDWSSLGTALSSSKTGLYALELCSHCADVRPSLSELRHLLSCNPRLRSLVVSGSGPSFPTDIDDVVDIIHHEFDGVLLPNLSTFTLGYRSGLEGQTVLQLINAPTLKSLVLEEATYPADPEDIDAGSLLTYIGTGEFHSLKERYLVAYDLPSGFHYQVKSRKDSAISMASTSTCIGSSTETGGRLIDDDDDVTLVDFDTKAHPPFPVLESVVLKNVRTSSMRPMSAFFSSLCHLERLQLVGMPMHALYTLLPDALPHPKDDSIDSFSPGEPMPSTSATASSSAFIPSNMPCPRLRSISIQDCNQIQIQDFNFVLNKLVSERKAHGSCSLQDIEIQLGPNAPISSCEINLQDGKVVCVGDMLDAQGSFEIEKEGVRVGVRRQLSPVMEDEDEDSEYSDDGTVSDGIRTPFADGGAFNDPYFDAYYTGASWISSR